MLAKTNCPISLLFYKYSKKSDLSKLNRLVKKSYKTKKPVACLIEKNILLEEYQNKMKYMQADFENYRKRIDKEKVDLIKKANEEIIVESIDVLESIEKSLNLTSEIKIEKTFIEGLKLTYDNLKKIRKIR